ncbi:Tat-linked quality control protein TatD [Marinomonas aquimarina]|uniref:Tat-linked quality control protein TatD n=1 Tax=Marinomonas aquimarina TaxID=295068 RepID=A0A1A8TF88_9GAMM|nr:TatD family hydrolase [Marinomonas aquimarina]SBS31697.1 Tat-linked quality control protein TatD [Marinomonas aquimarina]
MFDIGVNLDHSSYLDNLDQFREDYRGEGVQGILCIASNMDEAQKLSTLCTPYEDMHYTLGCHPHHASSWQEQDSEALLNAFARDRKAVAVGEMGLDFNRNYSTPTEQIHAFEAQLIVAEQAQKPVYLHERDAFTELTQRLAQATLPQSGVIHCFTGDKDQLRRYLDLGLSVGITGWLLDERRNQELIEALTYLPLDRLLLETDAPYLLPRNIRPRPKRNHPKFLRYIAAAVAELKGISLEEVQAVTQANTQRLFFSAR